MDQFLLYLRDIIGSQHCTRLKTVVFYYNNIENGKAFRNNFISVELYVINSILLINIYVSKILYVLLNHERVNDAWIRIYVPNIHIFQLVVLEKVLDEAVTILLVIIIKTMNPAQVLQGKDVSSVVYVIFTVQVSQFNALVHVRYFNLYCR